MTGAGSATRPRPASTVAVLRRGETGTTEVLLTHRPSTMVFGPGLHVFPGGAVDPGDGEGGPLARRSVLDPEGCAAAWAGDLAPAPALAHAVAAIRELWEEAGVLLAVRGDGSPVPAATVARAVLDGEPLVALVERLDLRLATDRLVPLSRWVTPPTADTTRRYDTRFFVADLPEGGEVAVDAREVAAHDWVGPDEALARYAAGVIDLWPPTSATLRLLAGAADAAAVRRHLSPVRAAPAAEVLAFGDAIRRARLGSGAGVPGLVVDAWLVGRSRVVVVDPGDPTEAGLDAILAAVAAVAGQRIVGVVATSAAPDHVGAAVGLALVAGVPLLASPSAAVAIGEPCEAVEDGAWICLGDVSLHARQVPGDEGGAMVLEAPELGMVLTGDLAGGGPSRGMPTSGRDESRGSGEALLAPIPGRRLPAHGD